MNTNTQTLPQFDFADCAFSSNEFWNIYKFPDGTALIEREDDDASNAEEYLPVLFSFYHDGQNVHVVIDDQIVYSFEYRLEDLIEAVEDGSDDDDDDDDEPQVAGGALLTDAQMRAIDDAARARRVNMCPTGPDLWIVYFDVDFLEFEFILYRNRCLALHIRRETTEVVLILTKDAHLALMPVIAPFMS